MELLLNLAWLLLAIPAYGLWRNSIPAGRKHGITSLQCLLALGCALVLLFPVISATDDLHAMRAEMEESSPSKRSVRLANSDRNSIPHTQSPPALLTGIGGFFTIAEFGAPLSRNFSFVPSAQLPLSAGRAPPAPSLA